MSTHEPVTERRLVLGPEDDGRVFSTTEFASAEFREPWKYERVGGRLVVMSPEGQTHHDASRPWRRILSVYWNEHLDLVNDVVQGAWLRVPGGTDRIGDIGVYLASRADPPPIPDRVPELMFEVVSEGQRAHDRDYVDKRADYERLSVREYVVIDPSTQQVTVFTHTPTGYTERILTVADVYTTPLLPGLAIPLADVFGN